MEEKIRIAAEKSGLNIAHVFLLTRLTKDLIKNANDDEIEKIVQEYKKPDVIDDFNTAIQRIGVLHCNDFNKHFYVDYRRIINYAQELFDSGANSFIRNAFGINTEYDEEWILDASYEEYLDVMADLFDDLIDFIKKSKITVSVTIEQSKTC